MSEWISVKDKLPKDDVLGWCKSTHCKELNTVSIVRYFNDGTWAIGDNSAFDYKDGGYVVTHWMPLPFPPEE